MRMIVLSCLAALVVLVPAAPALAASDGVDWTITTPASGQVIGDEVRVDGEGTHHLIRIAPPDIRGDTYAINGSVRFENVGDAAYLEMWSYFADGGAYYSRTLDGQGPMAVLSGDSDGRAFELPFALNGSEAPTAVEVNVVLPQGGTVWVGPLDLVGFGASTPWWTERQAALIGSIGGILAGLSGALLGVLAGRRKARRFVGGLMFGGASIGATLVVAAVVAAVASQPRHVWYPIGLLGVILAGVYGLLIPTVHRSYAAAELQRMRAMDA
jgi:hypothetical protein